MGMRCVVAANAVPRLGGQGLCLHNTLAGLGDAFALSVFTRRSSLPLPHATAVAPSAVARAINAVPLLRRRRDWQVLADDGHFDRWVAARLSAADLFHGVTGQCLTSLHRARSAGMRTVLDSFTVHADDLDAVFRESCAAFGIRSPLHPRQVARMRGEYGAADVIRTMSERARRTFLARGFPPERVIANTPPFDLAEFPVARFAHDRFRIAFVGLLEPWKGFQHLVAAFESLAVRDAELVLWGGPGSRPVSRYLAQHAGPERRIRVQPVDVRAHGYDRVYGASSVLVHPSLTDGFGFVVGEAMACGIPVIVSDKTGAADLVEDGRNGYVVPAGDVAAIRDRLEHLETRPALVREMGAAARATMADHTLERFRAVLVPRLRALVD